MRIYQTCLLSFFVFFVPASAHAAAYAVQSYNKDAQVKCDGRSITVPPLLFADMASVWLAASRDSCDADTAQVHYMFDKECEGQHVCTGAHFSYGNISAVAEAILLATMRQDAKPIALLDGVQAYLIPSTCNAYCRPTRLVWFRAGKIYSLDSKGTVQELIDAAKAYVRGSITKEREELS